MMRLGVGVIAIATLGACGGAKPPAPSKPAPQASKAAEPADDDPSLTYQIARTHTYRVKRGCAQGPFDLDITALGARRSEELEIEVCNAQVAGGQYRLERGSNVSSEGSFGVPASLPDECRAGTPERAVIAGTSSGGTATPAAADTPVAHGAAHRVEPAPEPLLEETVAPDPRHCSGTRVTDLTYFSFDEERALNVGEKLHLRIWSRVPSDYRKAVIVVRQKVLAPWVTAKDVADYLERSHKRWEKYVATHPDYKPEAPDTVGPPPPPRAEVQPPRASVHAEWIAGSWRWTGQWVWSAGFWKVPDSDLAADLTVHAPSAPPAELAEYASAAPPGAVWTQGHWQWNGAWIWVPGAWRLPPQPGLSWRRAGWRLIGGGAVFLPGGWVFHLH
jgi:hypothetical protein